MSTGPRFMVSEDPWSVELKRERERESNRPHYTDGDDGDAQLLPDQTGPLTFCAGPSPSGRFMRVDANPCAQPHGPPLRVLDCSLHVMEEARGRSAHGTLGNQGNGERRSISHSEPDRMIGPPLDSWSNIQTRRVAPLLFPSHHLYLFLAAVSLMHVSFSCALLSFSAIQTFIIP